MDLWYVKWLGTNQCCWQVSPWSWYNSRSGKIGSYERITLKTSRFSNILMFSSDGYHCQSFNFLITWIESIQRTSKYAQFANTEMERLNWIRLINNLCPSIFLCLIKMKTWERRCERISWNLIPRNKKNKGNVYKNKVQSTDSHIVRCRLRCNVM